MLFKPSFNVLRHYFYVSGNLLSVIACILKKIADTALFNPQWNWDIQILKETAANNVMATRVHSFVQ